MGANRTSENRPLENELRNRGLFPNTSAPWQQAILDGMLSKVSFNQRIICLDAACGIGNNIDTLSGYFNTIHGCDKSKNAVEFAMQRYFDQKGRIFLKTGDIQSLDYSDGFFDFVICTEALEHVKDHKKALNELYRVAKPNSYTIVSFQNHFNLSAVLKFFLEKISKKNWDAWGTHGYDGGYENYLTCFEVRSAVKDCGFTIENEFGADYINAWLSWVPYFYRNYKILNKYPVLSLGRIPILKFLGMDYFMLLKKDE